MKPSMKTGFPPMLVDATLPVPASLMTLLAGVCARCSPPLPSARSAAWPAGSSRRPGNARCAAHAGRGRPLPFLEPATRGTQFFSAARWNPDELGLAVAKLVAALLVPAKDPVTVAVDDTLFKRRGKKVWATSWFRDKLRAGACKDGVRQQLGGRRPSSCGCRARSAGRWPFRCWLS